MATEAQKVRAVEAFIDESGLSVNGRPLLIYATVLPHDQVGALSGLVKIKQEFSLGPETEIKWTLKHADRPEKEKIKGAAISVVARHCTCLLSVTEGDDKDRAFVVALRQLEAIARAYDYRLVGVNYDHDTFRTRAVVRAELEGWKGVTCTGLASHDSRFSMGIQLADMLAGVFRYMTSCAFGAPTKVVRVFDEGFEDHFEIRLDQLFHQILRYSVPGDAPPIRDGEEMTTEHLIVNALGKGIVLEGNFSTEERDIFGSLSKFYVGCMH